MNRISNLTRLVCTLLYVMTTYAYIYIYIIIYIYIYCVECTLNSRLLSGHLGLVAGTLRGSLFPVRYVLVGVQLTRLRALCSYFTTCLEKSERNCLTSYLCKAAILASYFLFACLKGCFRLSWSTRNKKMRTVTSKKHASRRANFLCTLPQL